MKGIIEVNGIDIWCETFGDKSKDAIILIAGAMAPATFWYNEFCEILSENNFVIRFDNRDFGYSTHFEELDPPPYSIMDMVDDVKGILNYFNKGKAYVIGHSLGGSIALLFGVKYPQMTMGITAISSPLIAKGELDYLDIPEDIHDEMWEILMSNPCHQSFEEGVEGFLKSFQYLHGNITMELYAAKKYIRRIYDTEPIIRPHLNHTNIQKDIPDIYDELMNASFPIMIIHGAKDYLAAHPDNVQMLADSLPNIDFYKLSGVGHLFFNKTIWRKVGDIILSELV